MSIIKSKRKVIIISFVLIAIILIIFGFKQYSKYREENKNTITIGSIKSSEESRAIDHFAEKYEADLLGKAFVDVLNTFEKYLTDNSVQIGDTIVDGDYNYVTNVLDLSFEYRAGDEVYKFIYFEFDANSSLTAISTNGTVGVDDGEKQRRERTDEGYQKYFQSNIDTHQKEASCNFKMQTELFFDYLSDNNDITTGEFVTLVTTELNEVVTED